MQEKIKITVPQNIKNLLLKDAVDFRITKNKREANLNAFINTLIINYYSEFSASEDTLRKNIKGALSEIPQKYSDAVIDKIIKTVADRERDLEEGGRSVSLSFKPTKQSERVVIYIENVLLKNESLSSFYRRMFIKFCVLYHGNL